MSLRLHIFWFVVARPLLSSSLQSYTGMRAYEPAGVPAVLIDGWCCSCLLCSTELYAELAGGVYRRGLAVCKAPSQSSAHPYFTHTHRDRYLDAYGEAEVRGFTERDTGSSTGESCPRLDVVYPDRALSACTWHCSLHCLFLPATLLFPHGVSTVV